MNIRKMIREFIRSVSDIAWIATAVILVLSVRAGIKEKQSGDLQYLFGYKPVYIQSGSMEPAIPKGSLVLIESFQADDLKPGDIICFQLGQALVTHRFIGVDEALAEKGMDECLITRGDANNIEDQRRISKTMIKGKAVKVFRFPAAMLAVFLIAAGSSAYWTENIEVENTVQTMDIGISYAGEQGNQLVLSENSFYPGSTADVRFSVVNTGSIAVDVRPVITIKAGEGVLMEKGGAEFELLSDNGGPLEGYTVSYFLEERKLSEEEKVYDKAVYECTDYAILASAQQPDRVDENGHPVTKEDYRFCLKLSENTGSDFANASAEVRAATLAIQHELDEELKERAGWKLIRVQEG